MAQKYPQPLPPVLYDGHDRDYVFVYPRHLGLLHQEIFQVLALPGWPLMLILESPLELLHQPSPLVYDRDEPASSSTLRRLRLLSLSLVYFPAVPQPNCQLALLLQLQLNYPPQLLRIYEDDLYHDEWVAVCLRLRASAGLGSIVGSLCGAVLSVVTLLAAVTFSGDIALGVSFDTLVWRDP